MITAESPTHETSKFLLELSAEELSPLEFIESVLAQLQETRGSTPAAYMRVFSMSALLDEELSAVADGIDIRSNAEAAGLPVLLDVSQTTVEMTRANRAVLLQEADLLEPLNTLTYALKIHINRIVGLAAEHYSDVLTQKESPINRMKRTLGIGSEPYEIPFTPNERELETLKELASSRFLSSDDAKDTVLRELRTMIASRPAMIGLEASASAAKFVAKCAKGLGGGISGPVDVASLRNLHRYMKDQGMQELQIYPEVANAIEERIASAFHQQVDS